jgi:heat shock protein HslJ
MKWIFTCIGIVLLASSCKTSKETMKTATPFFDTKWSLRKIFNGDKEETINTKAFIRFDQSKGSAGGNGSCNSFGSTASVNGNEVSFKNIFSTKMYCEQVQQIESKYFKQLQNVNRFEIKEKDLTLYHDKVKLLEFTAE